MAAGKPQCKLSTFQRLSCLPAREGRGTEGLPKSCYRCCQNNTGTHIFSTPTSTIAPSVQPRIKLLSQRAEANGSISNRSQSRSEKEQTEGGDSYPPISAAISICTGHQFKYSQHHQTHSVMSTLTEFALRALMWSSKDRSLLEFIFQQQRRKLK